MTCCKGFPLVLEVVGRSLCGEPLDTWRSRLLKLSEGQSIVNDEDEVRDCLQKSLDALDDKDTMLKEYFMDLGSFPEDHRIPATALIDMYAELHQLDHPIHAISNLHHLCSRNLLKLVITRYTSLLFVFIIVTLCFSLIILQLRLSAFHVISSEGGNSDTC